MDQYNHLRDWEQAMIPGDLQRLVAMMGAGRLQAAPFLATGPIDGPGEPTTRGDGAENES